MKVLFLDIDGVLNSEKSCKANGKKLHNDNPHIMHIRWLNYIISKTQAKIVISSTWRNSAYYGQMGRFLEECGLIGEVIAQTPKLDAFRGTEIKTWLLEHKDKIIKYKDSTWYSHKEPIESFVILDDDSDMIDMSPALVLTNERFGLTKKTATEAIKILNHKSLWKQKWSKLYIN